MATISKLVVELQLQAENFNNQIRAAQREAKELEKQIKPTTDMIRTLGETATAAGKTLTVALTAPIAAVAGIGLAFNAMQEQAHIAFSTMLGDGQKAKKFLDELKDFAATTPFEFPDLIKGAQRLVAMGFNAREVKPLLTAVGDAVAAIGGGSVEIDRVTLALSQMQGRGRVATQEMNQLTEARIPAWRMLAEGIGVTEAKLRDMVEKGLVPADRAIQILTDRMNDEFGGAMERQSRTFSGMVSTIKDESRFLAGELTTGLFNAIKGPAETVLGAIRNLRLSMQGWSDETKATITIVAAFAAALGPLLIVLGTLATSVSNLIPIYVRLSQAITASTLATTAYGAAMAALPIVAIGVGITALVKILLDLHDTWKNNKEAQDEFVNANMQMLEGLGKNIRFLKEHGIVINTTGKSLSQLQEEVALAMRAYAKWDDSVKAAGTSLEGLTVNLNSGIVVQSKVVELTEEQRKSIDKLKESVTGNKEQTMFLTTAIRELTSAKIPSEAIAKQLAARIKEEYENARLLGQEIDPLIAKLYALNVAKEAQKNLQLTDPVEIKQQSDEYEQYVNQTILRSHGVVNEQMQGIIDVTDALIKQGQVAINAQTTTDAIILESNNRRTQEQIKNEKEVADSYRQVWASAVGQVTANFVRGLSDVIFSGKSFGQAMTDLARNTARSMFEAFLTGLLAPLTSRLAGLGSQLAGVLGSKGGILGGIFGGVGGAAQAGGSAAGAAGTAGAAGAGGGLFGLGAATIPVIGGAIAGITMLATNLIGRGRRTANEFVQNFQNPFGTFLGDAVSSWQSAMSSGSMTRESGQQQLDSLRQSIDQFWSQASDFASQDQRHATVVGQAHTTLDPLISQVLSDMQQDLSELPMESDSRAATSSSSASERGESFGGGPVTIQIYQQPAQDTSQLVNELTRYFESNRAAAQRFGSAIPVGV